MKNKVIIIAVILLLFCGNIVLVFSLICKERTVEQYWYTIDSLSHLDYLRYNEECEFYGSEEKNILLNLPQPIVSNDAVVTPEDVETFWPTSVYLYIKKNGIDTPIHIHQHVWENPFSKRSILDLCFVMHDSTWIALGCLEFDTNKVEF